MYGGWLLGLDMVEQGISQILGGVKLEKKGDSTDGPDA